MTADRKAPFLLRASAAYVTALLASVFVFIIFCAAEGFYMSGGELFSSVWKPEAHRFGILPMIAATAALSLSALALGWLVSFGCVCYIHGFGGKRSGALLLSLLRMMTAVPTVVYGFASVFLLVPFIRDGFGGSGLSWMTATFILALLITPTMVLTMDGAVEQAARESRLAAASLGLSRAEHLAFVVLPSCREWLWGAALLGFGRAAGDTMIPTMLAGNAVQYPVSPLAAIRTLTAHIGLVLSSDVGGTAYYSLFAAGGILLALSTGANLIFRTLRGRKRREG
ncbi:ABC transporter permease subunit [Cloacibacillus sp. An23]|uniref:PstC family ABC transporter permease n=1 Tax=Cloacibacillus sp. An23 TaxID=1965591 RepID=UPI000B39B7A4|nr:ABC transporter permease subunit [Cloacibacillus sp. An23]OUO93269.1 ABC transporter permease [Cloacibacillus sp. An23]